MIELAKDQKVLYVLSALAEVDGANGDFLERVTGLSPEDVQSAIERLSSNGFVVSGGKSRVGYASLSNLGRSVFEYYWKKLKECKRKG